MIIGILTGLLILVLGGLGVYYGIAAIIAGLATLAVAIGLKKD